MRKASNDTFHDGTYDDDVVKTNLAAVLEQHGISNVRSM